MIRTLCGSDEKRVNELGLDKLPTYGLMKSTPRDTVRAYVEALEQAGYLHTNPTHRGIQLTEAAREVLFRGQPVSIRIKKEKAAPKLRTERRGEKAPQENPALFEELRSLRRGLADEEGIAAYMVFSDATLRDMAARAPQNESEFLAVSGVGAYKLKKYGKAFLDRIAQFAREG